MSGRALLRRSVERFVRLADARSARASDLAALPVLAFAAALALHDESGTAGDFLDGVWHPVSGLDHVLAMVAVGVWGAQLGAPAVWTLPVAFPLVMALGGMLALLGVELPAVELAIAASALVLGALVVTASRPPPWVAALVVGFFAIFHGHAHGAELPEGASGLAYSIGFVLATGALHGAGIALGLVQKWKRGEAVLRAAGALVAGGGAFFLWRSLA